MPELPEVEVVRIGLEKLLSDQPQICRFDFRRRDLRDPIPTRILKKLEGQRILSVQRRAKYLLFQTEQGGFLSHLGMTGTWRVARVGEEMDHDHLYLELQNGIRLAYRDPRRFGILDMWSLEKGNPQRLQHLGPEPFSPQFNSSWLKKLAVKKSISIKAFIMDQRVVVGVGNIYASEALFLAGVRPTKSVSCLKVQEFDEIVGSIQRVLSESIKKGGSSISDFYSFTGSKGDFQSQHEVYDRKGLPCRKCHNEILMKVISGRSTFWCPVCQS